MIPPGHKEGERWPVKEEELTHRQRLLAGQAYQANDPELVDDRIRCRRLLHQFNTALPYDDMEGRMAVLKELLGGVDAEHPPFIEPPLYCDFGYNIFLGKDTYMNFGTTILDCGPVHVGDRTLLGPSVQIYPVGHHVDPAERSGTQGFEHAKPVVIGSDCWIGGGAIIMQGITIGDGSTVAAGAVVTRDVEPYVVVAGNPARVLRRLQRPGSTDSAEPAAVAAADAATGAT